MADILHAMASLAWPLLAGVVAWKAGPALLDAIRERDVHAAGGPGGVEVSIGGKPISTEQAFDDQRKEAEALRTDLSRLASRVDSLASQATDDLEGSEEALGIHPPPSRPDLDLREPPRLPSLRRVLWVDDQPAKNSYELAALRDKSIDVVEALSTSEAMEYLEDHTSKVDAVVTDMHRIEAGQTAPTAGLRLLRAMRERDYIVPTIVYTSLRSAERHDAEVRELGGLAATADATKLFELLGVNLGPALVARLQAEARRKLAGMGFEVEASTIGGLDFVAHRDDVKIGVEVKAWVPPIGRRAVDTALRRLTNLINRGEVDQAWLISATPLTEDARRVNGRIRVLTLDDLGTEDGSFT